MTKPSCTCSTFEDSYNPIAGPFVRLGDAWLPCIELAQRHVNVALTLARPNDLVDDDDPEWIAELWDEVMDGSDQVFRAILQASGSVLRELQSASQSLMRRLGSCDIGGMCVRLHPTEDWSPASQCGPKSCSDEDVRDQTIALLVRLAICIERYESEAKQTLYCLDYFPTDGEHARLYKRWSPPVEGRLTGVN